MASSFQLKIDTIGLCASLILALLAASGSARADDRAPPADLAARQATFRKPAHIPFPAGNEYTPEAALLGRTLFFDARASGSGSLSCASCHNPSFGWEDGLAVSHGEGLRDLDRHAPTLLNEAWGHAYFWDGRAPSLEAQALGPLGSPREMNVDLAKLPSRLESIAGYRPLFDRAFPGQGISLATITAAVATFERTLASADAPFDQWLDGREDAISEPAKRGFVLFTGAARCAACHLGWRFTDDKFHDIGLPGADRGRAAVAPAEAEAMYAFKTPTLRDVARRAPYMHNGSLRTLEAVVGHYVTGGLARPSRSPEMVPLALSEQDITDLVAFLKTLSETPRSFPIPRLPQ